MSLHLEWYECCLKIFSFLEVIFGLDARFTQRSSVRIALEQVLSCSPIWSLVIGLYLTCICSVHFSFLAIVYDSTMPVETMVISSFHSEESRDSNSPIEFSDNIRLCQKKP